MGRIRDTESRILKVATAVFLQKGKHGARMQEIAERAGTNKALLYYYFRSKDRLYQRVFEIEFSRFQEGLEQSLVRSDDIGQSLRNFIDAYIDQMSRNPRLVNFILWEIRQGGGGASEFFERQIVRRKLALIEIIERAVRLKAIRPVDPAYLVMSIISMCVYPFVARPVLARVFPDLHVSSPMFLEKHKAEVFRLLWEGIGPQSGHGRKGAR
jgi:AcrR family transcriptional regulator